MFGYLTVLVVAFGVTLAMSYVVHHYAHKHKLYPKIRARDVHGVPTPRIGGIAMFCGLVSAMIVSWGFPSFRNGLEAFGPYWAIMAAAALICAMGVIDDLYELDWIAKLAGQIIAAGIVAWQGLQIVSLPLGGSNYIGSNLMSLAATVLFIVLVMNSINFIDGLDGLVAGVVAIAGVAFFLYSTFLTASEYQSSYFNLASLLSVMLVGVCLGFLPINWNPAKMFMGDSGSLVLGFLMACTTVSVTGQIDPSSMHARSLWVPTALPIVIPIAVMVVPLLDLTLAVMRRMGAGKSPFSADRKHLHHRMLNMGHGVRGSVLVFYGWTILFSFCTLLFLVLPWYWVVPIFGVGFVACFLITYWPVLVRYFKKQTRMKGNR